MNSFNSIIEILSNGLNRPLPGVKIHQIMEATSAKYLGLKPNERSRKSAVLMLLYPSGNEIMFPLILRNSYDGFHSGEVGFPGGSYEVTDEDLTQTALREAQEEIGVKPEEIKILGTLTELYIGPSDFLVLPVVGYLPHRPEFFPDSREVQEIFEMNLNYFDDLKVVGHGEIQIPGDLVSTPYYNMEEHKVWGATAKIIIELLAVLNNKDSDKKSDS